jgi:hypothetical protein
MATNPCSGPSQRQQVRPVNRYITVVMADNTNGFPRVSAARSSSTRAAATSTSMFARGVAVWGAEKHFFNLKSASRGHFRSMPERLSERNEQDALALPRAWPACLCLWPAGCCWILSSTQQHDCRREKNRKTGIRRRNAMPAPSTVLVRSYDRTSYLVSRDTSYSYTVRRRLYGLRTQCRILQALATHLALASTATAVFIKLSQTATAGYGCHMQCSSAYGSTASRPAGEV